MTKKYSGQEAYIYALVDPRHPDAIRYIGKAGHLESRMQQHLQPVHLKVETHKNRWIKTILAAGLKPQVIIIETTTRDSWEERERYWIAFYRATGCALTNATEGGDGNRGLKMTAEQKKKISDANKGRQKSDAEREHLREARLGKFYLGAAAKERVRQSNIGNKHSVGLTRSTETREKIRQKLLGRPSGQKGIKRSEETKEKLRQSHLGKKHSPESKQKRSDAIKKSWIARKLRNLFKLSLT